MHEELPQTNVEIAKMVKLYQGFIQGGGEPGTSPLLTPVSLPPKKLYFIHYDNQEKLIQLFSIKPLLYQMV